MAREVIQNTKSQKYVCILLFWKIQKDYPFKILVRFFQDSKLYYYDNRLNSTHQHLRLVLMVQEDDAWNEFRDDDAPSAQLPVQNPSHAGWPDNADSSVGAVLIPTLPSRREREMEAWSGKPIDRLEMFVEIGVRRIFEC